MQLVVEKRPGSDLCVLCVEDGKESRVIAIFVNDGGASVDLYKRAANFSFLTAHAQGAGGWP